ncbi:hypothetical protein M569_16637, partial [Genlisea aurea]
MAYVAQQFGGLKCPSASTFTKNNNNKLPNPSIRPFEIANRRGRRSVIIASASSAIASPEVRERMKLKELFEQAYERCITAPMEGVNFTLEEFHAALDKYDFNFEIGTKLKGTVFSVDANGAIVDITAKSSAYLPIREASLHTIKHVEEAGIFPGLRDEFVVIGMNQSDDSLVLSLRSIQYDLAWERCRQLQAEDVVVKSKV